MLDLWADEDDDYYDDEPPIGQWYKDDGRWLKHQDGKTLVIERVGWLFHRWRYFVVQYEGSADSLQEAKEKSERAIEPKRQYLRLVRTQGDK